MHDPRCFDWNKDLIARGRGGDLLARVGWRVGQPVWLMARAMADAKAFDFSPPALNARAADTAAASAESPPPAIS